jgi:hypothetical protein
MILRKGDDDDNARCRRSGHDDCGLYRNRLPSPRRDGIPRSVVCRWRRIWGGFGSERIGTMTIYTLALSALIWAPIVYAVFWIMGWL